MLAVKEALVQFDDKTKKPFVEIAIGDQEFERRDIEIGISDGIYVEIKSGISEGERIKVWNEVKPDQFAQN